VWWGANTVPTTIIRNITALSVRHPQSSPPHPQLALINHPEQSQIAYEASLTNNLTTLSNTYADPNGVIQGLLYVPDLSPSDPCYEKQYDLIPRNVTRQANLPPTNYNLIALAPWFNASCTKSYLAAARLDPIRAFIFYRPNNSTYKPQPASSPIWDLMDDGDWQNQNHFPIFAVPGQDGASMMRELSRYSGNLTQIPYGKEITDLYGPNSRDYVRIWTELTLRDPTNPAAMWTYFLIVIGAVLILIGTISALMHLVQRGRRAALRYRVMDGEVDLEAMGIKRLTVPEDHVKGFPLFTYSGDPELSSVPPTTPRSPRSPRSSRRDRALSDVMSPTGARTRRSGTVGSVNTEATNFQPKCHICLDRFEHRVSVIRELPCQHIFHPECIDEFLSKISSLCPICKRSILPRGYSPKITNGMVRRERAIRRLRERVEVEEPGSDEGKSKSWGKRLFMTGANGAQEPPEMQMTPIRTPKTPRVAKESGTPAASHSPPAASHPTSSQLPSQQASQTQPQPTIAEDPEPPQDVPASFSSQAAPHAPPQTTPADETTPTSPADPAASTETRRNKKARTLRIEVPPPEGPSSNDGQTDGRRSPTARTRERMRTLAGLPFTDPEAQQSIC
jgi:hypothetical protein